ncbi:ABC transporter permease [Lactobacillus sp. ESL0791]|uniref:ABC transporter permease n=1 Tax=Lactobacillus sp. ESL0791 TaxID=2983234 RepID=UPI0023F99B30|nr:ABC transporter permease [Lactobacillus sp. ESL0791]MDF7639884.1 ABC transporter permease [Lactobacillus sp. ESL0791]
MNDINSEFCKLFSLPSAWLAFLVSILIAPVITAINSYYALSDLRKGILTKIDPGLGFQELAFGVAGIIILGVIMISSEYFTENAESGNSRQITTSLLSVPARLRLLLSKCVVTTLVSAFLAIIASVITFLTIKLVLGSYAPAIKFKEIGKFLGVIYYWVLTALLALAITVFTRNGIIPLTFLILNSSVVTVSYLLAKTTILANYLPDMAGLRMFTKVSGTGVSFSPLLAGTIMTAWITGLFLLAAIVFCRRDV